ncbi:MAG: flagellar biosynthetic protein FliO [Fibrobacterota bacterium]
MNRLSMQLFLFFIISLHGICTAEFNMEKVRRERGGTVTAPDTASAVPRENERDEVSVGVLVLRIFFSLTILTLLIILVLWGVKRSGLLNANTPGLTPSLEIMETITTGRRGQEVVLLRHEKEVFLMGQTEQHLTLLKSFDASESARIIADKRGNETVSAFQGSLNRFVASMKRGENDEA